MSSALSQAICRCVAYTATLTGAMFWKQRRNRSIYIVSARDADVPALQMSIQQFLWLPVCFLPPTATSVAQLLLDSRQSVPSPASAEEKLPAQSRKRSADMTSQKGVSRAVCG